MEKKQYITIGIVAIIAIAGVSGVVVYMNMPKGGTFVFGVMYGPVDLDPHQSWVNNAAFLASASVIIWLD